ncbi:MAG: hypothetical protein AB7U45_12420 [Desulfamplus sp.]
MNKDNVKREEDNFYVTTDYSIDIKDSTIKDNLETAAHELQVIEPVIVQENEDPLVTEAFEYLKDSFRKHFHEAMLEAGRYLIDKFYDNDYEWVRKGKRPKKKESLNKLIERLQANSSDAPSKTWIYDAVKLVADDHFFQMEGGTIFRAYGKLGHSQKLRLAYIKQPEIKKRLIEEIVDHEEPFTDRDLRKRIAEEKGKIPKKERVLSIFEVIKSHKNLTAEESRDVERFDNINTLDLSEINKLIENYQEVVGKINSEIEKRKQEIDEYNKQLYDYSNVYKRIKAAKNWKETLIKREHGEQVILQEETPLLKKLRDAVQFMCFWKGYHYADICLEAWVEYVPLEEAKAHLLQVILRKGKCDLKPTYDFELTKEGKIKWLSQTQVENKIKKGTFWMSKEKYDLLNNKDYYDYK